MLDKILSYHGLSVCLCGGGGGGGAAAAVAAAPKRKVSFGAEMSPAKVVVGWHGSGADCSEAEEEESIYSEEERVGQRRRMTFSNLWWDVRG